MADQVPPEWSNRIMHATLELGDRVLMGGDAPPGANEELSGFTGDPTA